MTPDGRYHFQRKNASSPGYTHHKNSFKDKSVFFLISYSKEKGIFSQPASALCMIHKHYKTIIYYYLNRMVNLLYKILPTFCSFSVPGQKKNGLKRVTVFSISCPLNKFVTLSVGILKNLERTDLHLSNNTKYSQCHFITIWFNRSHHK